MHWDCITHALGLHWYSAIHLGLGYFLTVKLAILCAMSLRRVMYARMSHSTEEQALLLLLLLVLVPTTETQWHGSMLALLLMPCVS